MLRINDRNVCGGGGDGAGLVWSEPGRWTKMQTDCGRKAPVLTECNRKWERKERQCDLSKEMLVFENHTSMDRYDINCLLK